jgi:O-antigen/teichoic acid export membrane protein
MSRLRKVIGSFVAFAAGNGLNILANLVLIPLYLSRMGARSYGEWLAVSSLVAYLSTLDAGFQTASVNQLTTLHFRNEETAYRELLGAGTTFYAAVSLGLTLFAIVAIQCIPFGPFLGIALMSSFETKLALSLLSASVAVNLFSGFVFAADRTIGNLATSQWLANIQRVVSIGLSALSLVFWPTAPMLALASLTSTTGITGIALWRNRRGPASSRLFLGRPYRRVLFPLIRPSADFAGIVIANALTVQGVILVIARVLGSEAVVVYSICKTVANLPRQIVSTIVLAVWTEFTRMLAQGNNDLARTSKLLVVLSSSLALSVATVISLEGAALMGVWTGKSFVAETSVFRILLFQVVLVSPCLTMALVSYVSNHSSSLSKAAVISSVVGLGASGLVARRLGLTGVAWAGLLAEVLLSAPVIFITACKQSKISPLGFGLRIVGGLLVGAALCFASAMGIRSVVSGLWTASALEGLSCLVLAGVSLMAFVLGPVETLSSAQRLRIGILARTYRKWA